MTKNIIQIPKSLLDKADSYGVNINKDGEVIGWLQLKKSTFKQDIELIFDSFLGRKKIDRIDLSLDSGRGKVIYTDVEITQISAKKKETDYRFEFSARNYVMAK